MSYILDALRRAEAERQRGSVPDLNTPGVALPAANAPAARRRTPLWVAGAALAVVALTGLLWLGLGARRAVDAPAQVPAMAVPAVAKPPQATVPAPAAVAAPVPAPVPAPAPVVVVVPPPLPASAVAVQTPAPAAAPVQAPVQLPAPAAAQAPANSAQRAPSLSELPEALRRQVPALTLGGSMYSEQPAQRLVIINGQVAHEGDEAAPGVRVVQIRPKAVVFAVGGQRFEMPL